MAGQGVEPFLVPEDLSAVSIEAAPTEPPSTAHRGPLFSTPSPALGICARLDSSPSDRHELIAH